MRGKQTIKRAVPTHHEKWGWFLALGIILIILGVLAAIFTVPAAEIAAWSIGCVMLAAGIIQILHAFTVIKWGQFLLWLAAGILYTVAGIVVTWHPVVFVPLFTIILAIFLVIAGVVRMFIGFRVHYINGAAWIIINGIVTTLLGLIIIVKWDWLVSFWIFGALVAIDLIFQGIGWVAFACGLKQLNR